MRREIDIEALLAPISEEKPGGEDLRYSDVYDRIKDARRYDEVLEMGEWQREIKTADWDKVISLAAEALSTKTKDLQIALWLTEALIMQEEFEGLAVGMRVVTALLENFWDHFFPVIEENDVEPRIELLAFLNDKLWLRVKQVPLTEKAKTAGYSWLTWQESREVGYESETRDKFGDVDENKKNKRDELVAEGKITAEEFDKAVAASSAAFFTKLSASLDECMAEFERLQNAADECLGPNSPSLRDFGAAIGDCSKVVQRIGKDKIATVSAPEAVPRESESRDTVADAGAVAERPEGEYPAVPPPPDVMRAVAVPVAQRNALSDTDPWEQTAWDEALTMMGALGIRKALERLLEVSLGAPSLRERHRYRLLIAKLCLKAERPDLALPIVEELNTIVEQLQLEHWESPVWVAEVYGTLYRCLMSGEPSDDDQARAQVLFRRLCALDVAKAIGYKT